jgi:hypothetical protein
MATYRIGSKGDDIKKLQQQLKAAGYDPGGVDGIYGKNTAAAVKAYQKANNLTADGIAGSQTLGSLSSLSAPPNLSREFADVTPYKPPAVSTPAISTPALNTPDITGLIGLRDFGTGKGLDIGWAKDTGPTANGIPISTAGLVNKDGKYYGSLDQLNKIFAPYNTTPEAPAPYVDPYADRINALLDKYLSQKPFSYDPEDDPSYEAYKDMYTRAGETAFQDTIGDLSALTGGRINSWATSAASQARNNYMEDLNNIIPTLEAAAYARHQDKYANLANQLQMLQGLGESSYGRYRDTVGDYQTDRAFNRGVLESDRAYNRGVLESDRAYNYQVTRDKVLDDQWLKQFDYQTQRDLIEDAYRNRQISITEANTALNKAEFEYRKEQDKKAEKKNEPPTPGQLAYYNQIKEGFMNNGKSPSENLAHMENIGKKAYVDMMGEQLYNQLVSDLQSATQPVKEESLITPKDEAAGYIDYIESSIVPKDNLGNLLPVDEEARSKIDAYLGQLQNGGVHQDILIYLANKYGVPIEFE